MRLSFQILPLQCGASGGGNAAFPHQHGGVQSLLKRIGVDGVRCQEYFIISFDSDILGLYDYLSEYENIESSTIWPIC